MSDTTYDFHREKGILLLSDGTAFEGVSIGIRGTATGELCFNTSMMGYQEIFTDPSYKGQLLVLTTPHVGNYGILDRDTESESQDIQIEGLICKMVSPYTSRNRPHKTIKEYFQRQNKVVLSNVDTRAVVAHIRTKGAMNAIISTDTDLDRLTELLRATPPMKHAKLATEVSAKTPYHYGNPASKWKIALIDLGVKKNILRMLQDRDCYVKVFPCESPWEDIKRFQADGILLSNGPGDPSPLKKTIDIAQKAIDQNIPTFGICLGHQIIGLAVGLEVYKMHNGHRGANHPVKNLDTDRCEITSQNHGFALKQPQDGQHTEFEITHTHLNDHSIAGIKLKNAPCFSVQYHPESAPGPEDSRYLFDQFIHLIAKRSGTA